MKGLQVIGLDIAKHVFQLHSVDMETGEIINVQIKRAKVLTLCQQTPEPDRNEGLRRRPPLG